MSSLDQKREEAARGLVRMATVELVADLLLARAFPRNKKAQKRAIELIEVSMLELVVDVLEITRGQ